MDLTNLENPTEGMLTLTAHFYLRHGHIDQQLRFNTVVMKKPFVGERLTMSVLQGNLKTHLVGVLGGVV